MLRIVVISLFVANLLLLGFQGSRPAPLPEPAAKETVVQNSSVPTIHLFSEMMENRDLMSGNRQCFSLGPFRSTEDREEVRDHLLEMSVSISERQTQALVEKGYWVYMPPYISLLEANQELLSLQALGLEDIGIIFEGEWENAISLGYFLRQKNALRRKKGLEDRGYEPSMRVQRQAEPRYWLDYEQLIGSDLITLDMQDRPNDFMQRALPCAEQDPFAISAGNPQPPAADVAQLPLIEGGVEFLTGLGGGIDPEEETEGFSLEYDASLPGNGDDTIPVNINETAPDDNNEAVSGQSTETETDSGNEVDSGEG